MAIAFLLQGALGGVFVIILAIVAIVAVVVLGGIFGGALQDRGGGQGGEAGETETQNILPQGTILAAVGLGLAVIGAFSPSVALAILGMVMGAMSYFRGSRILGIAVSVLSLAAIFLAIWFGGESYKF